MSKAQTVRFQSLSTFAAFSAVFAALVVFSGCGDDSTDSQVQGQVAPQAPTSNPCQGQPKDGQYDPNNINDPDNPSSPCYANVNPNNPYQGNPQAGYYNGGNYAYQGGNYYHFFVNGQWYNSFQASQYSHWVPGNYYTFYAATGPVQIWYGAYAYYPQSWGNTCWYSTGCGWGKPWGGYYY